MKWLFAVLLSTSISLSAGNIAGIVTDAENGDPLAGASITLAPSQRGATSDADGYFQISNIPNGDYTIRISYLGYTTIRKVVRVNKDAPALQIALIPSPFAGKTVTVVATRAIEGETPAAFSTLTREEIQTRYYAQDIPVLLSELPSTTFYSESGNGLGYNYLSIRGFDQRRISVMINGVPQNDPEDHNVYWLDFPDFLDNVEDIQVQRGAGSAFYGPPAIGGSINIITSAFSPERRLTIYSGGGDYGTSKFSMGANTGLINERWVLNARVSQVRSDGYRESSGLDFKSYFIGAAYFGDKSSTRLQFYGGPIEDELAYYGISKEAALDPERRRVNPISDPREIENFNQPHLELINTYEIGENTTLNNTLYYIKGTGFFDYDGSWAPFSYFRLTPEFGFSVQGDPGEQYASDVLIRAYVDNDQLGWFPNLTWRHDRGQVIGGAELRTHRSLHWGRIQDGSADLPVAVAGDWSGQNYIGSRRYYEYKGGKDILSPYLFTTYRAGERFNINAALQLVWQRYRLFEEAFIGTDFSIDYLFLNPRIGVQYQLTSNLNAFTSFSRTSREPRLKNYYDAAEASTPAAWGAVVPQFARRPDGRLDFNDPLVKPEKLNDIELGMGYATPRAEGHINLFYMDFRDEIVKSGQLDRFGQPVTGNAPRSRHTGIELSGRLQPLDELGFSGNATFSNNELVEYAVFDYDDNFNTVEQRLDGNAIAGFPDFLANARVNLQHRGVQASLGVQHVGKFYTDNFENAAHTVDAHTVFHGVIGFDAGSYLPIKSCLLQLHVRNIFDKLYIAHGEGGDFFPAAERHFFVNARIAL